jgi:hypothetical protein
MSKVLQNLRQKIIKEMDTISNSTLKSSNKSPEIEKLKKLMRKGAMALNEGD